MIPLNKTIEAPSPCMVCSGVKGMKGKMESEQKTLKAKKSQEKAEQLYPAEVWHELEARILDLSYN